MIESRKSEHTGARIMLSPYGVVLHRVMLSPCSLGIHDVEVIDRGKLTPLTPIHVGNITDLTIEREKRLDNFSCLRLPKEDGSCSLITGVSCMR